MNHFFLLVWPTLRAAWKNYNQMSHRNLEISQRLNATISEKLLQTINQICSAAKYFIKLLLKCMQRHFLRRLDRVKCGKEMESLFKCLFKHFLSLERHLIYLPRDVLLVLMCCIFVSAGCIYVTAHAVNPVNLGLNSSRYQSFQSSYWFKNTLK